MNTSSLSAEHFNDAQTLQPVLIMAASRLLKACAQDLGVTPATADFEAEFQRACAANGALQGGPP